MGTDCALEIKAVIVGFFGMLTALFGWFGWLIIMLFILMIVDYGTGSILAMHNGEWSSKKAREGIWHKVGAMLAVLVAGFLDIMIGLLVNNVVGQSLSFDYTVLICPIVVVWYILTEMGSIVENIGDLGCPVPVFLRKAIKVFQTKVNAAGESIAKDENEKELEEEKNAE